MQHLLLHPHPTSLGISCFFCLFFPSFRVSVGLTTQTQKAAFFLNAKDLNASPGQAGGLSIASNNRNEWWRFTAQVPKSQPLLGLSVRDPPPQVPRIRTARFRTQTQTERKRKLNANASVLRTLRLRHWVRKVTGRALNLGLMGQDYYQTYARTRVEGRLFSALLLAQNTWQ